MKIYTPTLVGETQAQSSYAAPPEPASIHSHSNLAILSRLSLTAHGLRMWTETSAAQVRLPLLSSRLSVVRS